jgi:hypothetical protein
VIIATALCCAKVGHRNTVGTQLGVGISVSQICVLGAGLAEIWVLVNEGALMPNPFGAPSERPRQHFRAIRVARYWRTAPPASTIPVRPEVVSDRRYNEKLIPWVDH